MTDAGTSFLRRLAATAVLLATLVVSATSAGAQSFPGIGFSSPAPGATSPLDALFSTTPITLDGHTLFRIAVPNGTNGISLAARANAVSLAIDEVLSAVERDGITRTVYDPHSLQIRVGERGGQVVLEAVDAHHAEGLVIVTVTSADSGYRRLSVDAVAQQWQAILQTALVSALIIRQPDTQRRNVTTISAIAAGLVAFTILVAFLIARLSRSVGTAGAEVQQHRAELALEQTRQSEADDAAATAAHQQRLLGLMVLVNDPQRRLSFYRTLRVIVIVLVVAAWFGAVSWGLLQFPQTASLGGSVLRKGIAVAGIWIVTLLVDRVLTLTVDRLPTLWELRAFGTPEDNQRQLLRAPTIARALGGLKTFVLIFVAGLATLTLIGIPVGSVVTIGSIAALAISLAAQNLIRDVVSGFLVLIEDQFVVGDFVTINGNRGTVERLTLRMVQVRDGSGSLVTIAHSGATSVINHSRNWSRVDYEISVNVGDDIAQAISILRQQIAALEADPEWSDAIVEPAEWIGIDAMSRDGAIVRARIKTAPLRQFALRRELNARVLAAFAAAKIGYGAPVPPTTV